MVEEAGVTVDLLERSRERSEADAALERARSGSGSILVIEGPAGIGKTALAREVRRRAEEARVRTLWARGGELERDFPYGVVRQLLEPVVRGAGSPDDEGVLDGAARFAAPALGLAAPEAGPTGPDLTPSILHGLYWLVSNLTEAGPLLVAVDDAHWADRASLAFFHYLGRRIEELPVCLLLTERRPEAGIDEPALSRILAEPTARVLRPAPLSPTGVAALVAEALGRPAAEEFCAACHATTGGNPFLLRELLREIEAEGIAPDAGEATAIERLAPDTVSRSVLLRLSRLPLPAQQLARAVAVLGGGADLPVAAAVGELDPEDAAEAADTLASAGILAPTRPLEFLHPLLRQAVDAELGAGERATAHRRAAAALADAGAPTSKLALHLLAADPAEQPWAVAALRAAAEDALAEGAPARAAELLRRALAEPPDDADRLDVMVALGRAQARAGDPEAMDTLTAAMSLGGDPHARAEVALDLATALAVAGDMAQAVSVLRNVDTHGLDADLALRIESALVSATLGDPDADVQDAAGAKLFELLPQADPPRPASARLLSVGSLGALVLGMPTPVVADMARKAFAGGVVHEEGYEFTHAAAALIATDRFDEASRAFDEALAEARRLGSPALFAMASAHRGRLRYRLGQLRDAEHDCRASVELVLEHGWEPRLELSSAWLADTLVEQGELAEADTVLARVGPPWTFGRPSPPFLISRGQLRALQGRLAEAAEDLRSIPGLRAAGRSPSLSAWRSALALVLVRLGETDEARRLAEEELEMARAQGAPRAIGAALRALGLVVGGEAGLEHLRAAVQVLETSPALLERARALSEFGAALRRQSQRREAREQLRAALDLAVRCGANLLAERTREELLAAGARPRRVAVTGVDALTASERRVAQLAADGLSNKEIAQALFVSVRTVTTHLTHTYEKLQIEGRQQLAAALEPKST